jgi:hypothetical protein
VYFRADTARSCTNVEERKRGSSLVDHVRVASVHPFTQQACSHFESRGSYHRAYPPSTMSESPYPRNPVLSRPAFTGRVSSPLSRPHFPWTTYLHRPSSASPAPTGASANWDSASTASNTSQTYPRNPSAIVPQYNEETNMRQWTFTVCLSLSLAYH